MQNIEIQHCHFGGLAFSQGNEEFLQSTISTLKLLGGSSVPRSTLVINILSVNSNDFLLEASFFDALGKLTGFKTVVVRLRTVRLKFKNSNYDMLDEYLKVMLGGGEAAKLDEAGRHCLTYHPRGRAACGRTASV